jgi:adenosylcobinamide kinase / adenosylcobinamide-phosphate guanylyltransferase
MTRHDARAKLVLILGGVRSGKSRFGERLARKLGGDDVGFVATGEAWDDEMRDRIARHQQSRPTAWPLLEAPRNVGPAIKAWDEEPKVLLVDCLTMLVSNVLLAHGESRAETEVRREVHGLRSAIRDRHGPVILVSGEVGQGVVPTSSLGRAFRDLLGWANQDLASEADQVFLMVAGLPIEAKSLATTVDHVVQALEPGESG